MRVSEYVAALASGLLSLLLIGCGWGGTPPGPVPPAPKPLGYTLGGNWLLYGALPSLSETNANGTPGGAFSFDVQNGIIHGSATVEAPCTMGGSLISRLRTLSLEL